MTRKADFNAEEWSTVVEGPVYAGLRVSGAHRGGTLRESLAIGRVYQEARQRQGQSELLDEIVASPPAIDRGRIRQELADGEAFAQRVIDRLRRAMSILEERATKDEVDAYKTFVMTVGQAAAEAHKEGGFLGIGGQRVSEAEDKALDEISIALGPPPGSS